MFIADAVVVVDVEVVCVRENDFAEVIQVPVGVCMTDVEGQPHAGSVHESVLLIRVAAEEVV